LLETLQQSHIEQINLAEEIKNTVSSIFDQVSNCTPTGRCESTDASKMPHTMLPDFFVMWDRGIRRGLLGDPERKSPFDYAYRFLPLAQKDIIEAIETCANERNIKWEDAVKYIRNECNDKTLTKLVDEFNYVKYTLNISSFQQMKNGNQVRNAICPVCGKIHTLQEYQESRFCRNCGKFLSL